MKPVDVKPSTYTDSSKEINDKDSKFKSDDIVRISKCKNIFAKGYTPQGYTHQCLKKWKTLCCGHMLLVILKVK